jgi:spore coat protein CotH
VLSVGACGESDGDGVARPSHPAASDDASVYGGDAGRHVATGDSLASNVTGPGEAGVGPVQADGGSAESSESRCLSCDAAIDPTPSDGTSGDAATALTTNSTSGGSTSDTSDGASRKWLEGEPLFSQDGIAELRLQISEEGIAALNMDAKTYVPGSFTIVLADGTELTRADVGMRLKGQLGSARTLQQKAAFLLKMNEFVADQKLLGLNKLALNNMVQDPSMIREQLAYLLFREMGVPAPRTSYASVTLNGELMGLYATVEVVDNASFLDHWFGDDNGNLYEGSYGSDLEPALVETFDQDRGDDSAFTDLYELTAALDAMVEPSTFAEDSEPWLELDQYARFAATELFLAHWDGYAATRNNYYLYRAPGAKWTFLPWGTDQTFGDTRFPIFEGNGRVQGLCGASLVCRQKLGAAYEALMTLVEELDLLGRVDDLETLISQAAALDPRKEVVTETVHTTIEGIREFLRVRPTVTRELLVCTDPSNVDRDGDGASGCGDDCADGDPTRYPGATEVCNFVDDDCNGQIDELDECEACVEHTRSGGGSYAFCFGPSSYEEAQADCRDRGGDLIAIHSEEELEEVEAQTSSIGTLEWWIGLSDRETEGEFRWEDSSALDFERWNAGEPNDSAENEDCAQLTPWGAWNDRDCGTGAAYICQLP